MTFIRIANNKISTFRTLLLKGERMLSIPCILITAFLFGASWAHAKAGRITVTNTATVNGTGVHGTITIFNEASSSTTITEAKNALEVRFRSDYGPIALPPGYKDGYYRVAVFTFPVPASTIPAGGKVQIPYVIDTCDATVAEYDRAKAMRSVTLVSVDKGDIRQGITDPFAPPSQDNCSVCGNGIIEEGEECDGGGCCTETCDYVDNGTFCDDGDACTQTDECFDGACVGTVSVLCQEASDQCYDAGTCDPATEVCPNPPTLLNGIACDDGNSCTTNDTCQNGTCIGTPIVCDDDNVCTSDECVDGECFFTNNTNPCEDGSECTTDDFCEDGTCQSGPLLDCDDFKARTDDVCVEGIGCTHTLAENNGVCEGEGCVLCKEECSIIRAECVTACWDNFSSCLAGCTSTYCAPFCQVDLGSCLNACPDEIACWKECEIDNSCGADCL